MMDDNDTELSLDSFVDIIANTVGIVIILSIFTTSMAKDAHQLDSVNLSDIIVGIEQENEGFAGTLSSLKGSVQSAELAEADRTSDIDSLNTDIQGLEQSHGKTRGLVDRVRVRAQNTRSNLSGIKKSQNDEKKRLAELHKEFEGLGEEYLEAVKELRSVPLQDLQDEQKNLNAERLVVSDYLNKNQSKKQAWQTQLAQLKLELQSLNKEVEKVVLPQRIMLRDPLANMEHRFKPVWVECYAADKVGGKEVLQLGRVRLVNSKNYSRVGNTLKPKQEGESLPNLESADSKYRKALVDIDKATHFIYFVVRSDAFDAFREARELAWKAGWRVRWDPIDAGETIVLETLTKNASIYETESRPGASGE